MFYIEYITEYNILYIVYKFTYVLTSHIYTYALISVYTVYL